MFEQIQYVIYTIFLGLRFPQKIKMNGIQAISSGTRINIIGNNSKIYMGKVRTSTNVHISAVSGGSIHIGKGVFLNRNSIIISRQEIVIEDDCIFGPNVVIYDHDHRFSKSGIDKEEYSLGKISIGRGTWIGSGAIILKNTEIGEGCVIGAGSVVKGKIPDHSIVKNNRDIQITQMY